MAITHPAGWGVRPDQDDVPGQVIWVWNELAFGLLYGIEALGRTLGKDWSITDPQDDWKIVHFLGYDNTFYHSIFCPALFKIAHPGWTPDMDYHLNEFYLLDGDKFSTSRRHAIWGKDFLTPGNVDSVRFYLSLTRPETHRTNFTLEQYEAVTRDTLVGTWQRWLDDLGARLAERYDGVVPDAGIWTPEHTAFWARLESSLRLVTGALSQDGFSLNQAAQALDGIVADTVRFSNFEAATAELPEWKDEARTTIALELAAASLLAHCALPVMPRFAARLGEALGIGTPADLARDGQADPAGHQGAPGRAGVLHQPAAKALLPWLSGVVAQALQAGDVSQDATLVGLGIKSMQAIALQYQILERTGIDLDLESLLGDRTIADLAAILDDSVLDNTGPDDDDEVVV